MAINKPRPPYLDGDEKPILGEMRWKTPSTSSDSGAPKKVHPTPESPLRGRILCLKQIQQQKKANNPKKRTHKACAS